MLSSLYHFSDTESKTEDGYFVGFPAIWNVVVLYCFVLDLPAGFPRLLIAICVFLTFIPLLLAAPVRVRRLRLLNLRVRFSLGRRRRRRHHPAAFLERLPSRRSSFWRRFM